MLFDRFGNPVPPKEPPRSDVKRLPQSALQLQPKSLTRLLPFCLFVAFCLSNGCAARPCGFAPRKINSEWAKTLEARGPMSCSQRCHHAIRLQRCNRSIQRGQTIALKPLGVQKANVARASCAWFHGRDARGLRNFRGETADRRTPDKANPVRGFLQCRESQANNRSGNRSW